MATAQNIIRTLTIRSKVEGADKTQADLKGIQSAHEGVVRVTDSSAKGQLSLADAVAKSERRFNASIRAQQDFEKVQRQMNLAVAQNPTLQARANAVLALAAQHFDQVSKGQRALSTATQAANDNLRGFASQTGLAGAALVTLGPWGIAAAAAIAVATLALKGLSHEAGRFADEMGKLRDTAQIIDLTSTQLQALNDKGAEFALTPDKIATGLQRFTAQLEEARRGEGELFTQMQRLDPAMALQFARTRDTASALDLYASALSKANAAERTALSRAGLGRGGFDVGLMLSSVAKSGGLNSLTDEFKKSGDAIDTEIIEKVRKLKREIDDMASDARNNLASVFSVQTLEAEKKFTSDWLDFSRSVKNFSISGDLRYLLETVLKIKIGGPGTLLGAMGIDYGAGYKAPPAAARPDTFAQRFQPANDNPLKPFSMDERDRNAAILDLNLYRQRIAILGEAATASERYKLRQLEINAAVAKNAELQPLANRALAAAAAAFKIDAMRDTVSALGAAATATEHLALREVELEQRVRSGAISRETMNRALADFKNDQSLTFLRNNVAALGNAATAAQQYEVQVRGLQQQLDRGQISQQTFNRAVFEANPIVQELKDSFGDLAKGIVQSMVAGKSFTDSLSTGLASLSARLADKAIESLLSGDFAKAAIAGISAVVTAIGSLLTKSGDLKGVIDRLDRLNQLRLRAVTAGADTETLAGRMEVFNANALLEMVEEARKGGHLMGVLLHVQQQERLAIERDFQKRAADIEKQAAEERLRAQEEIENRRKSFQDRLFSATNDPNSLEGQLAAFDRQAMREIIEERDAGGQAMIDLERAQLAERANIVRDFHEKEISETKRAAQEKLDIDTRAARQVLDYITNLQVGPDSSLAPTQKFAAADATFNATYALAQTGNLDALARVTQDFENARKANQAINASSAAYQTYLAQGIAKLHALPVVQTSTDPVVQQLLAVQLAIQATTAAVTAGTDTLSQAMDLNHDGIIDQSEILEFIRTHAANTAGYTSQTVGRLDTSIGRFDTAIARLGDTVNNLITVIDRINSSNALLDAIISLQDIAKQQLQLLNQQLSGSTTPITVAPTDAGSLGRAPVGGGGLPANYPTQDLANNMITALNKIVWNTWAIAKNTATLTVSNSATARFGVYAQGGWINGGIPGRDSVPIMAMPDEYMVQRSATAQLTRDYGAGIMDMINAGRLPTQTNVIPFPSPVPYGGGRGDTVSLRVVEAKLDKLIQVLSAVGAAIVNAENQTGTEVANKVVAALGGVSNAIKEEARHDRANPQNKKVA